MKVVVESEQSKSVTVESGVPQGTVRLGPLMFLCHINDLPDVVRSQVRLFADDCLLYRQIKSNEDHVLLKKISQNWKFGLPDGACDSTKIYVTS